MMRARSTLQLEKAASRLRHMPWKRRTALWLLGLALAFAAASAAEDATPHLIRYEDDRLSVHLERVPVGQVLAEIARTSGAEIRGEVRDPRDVTAEFENVPLSDALHRLLGDQNFALIYGDKGALRAVKLLGGPQPPGKGLVLFTPSTTVPSNVSPLALIAAFERHPPLPISGRLAQTLGTNTATFRQLFDAAVHQEDAEVRSEALRAWLGGFEGDNELRSNVLSSLNNMDESTLTTMLRSMTGARAEEMMLQISTLARGSDVRVKASSLLQKLHQQDSGG